MTESIKTKQRRVIRRGYLNDRIYTQNPERTNCIGYLAAPIMGKTIKDIKVPGTRLQVFHTDTIITKGKTFKLYSIGFKHTSSSLYVITVNDRIYYYTISPIFAPASSAWHTLTEVYFGYKPDGSSEWLYFGLEGAECFRWNFEEGSKVDRRTDFEVTKDQNKIAEAVNRLYYHL